MGELLNLMQSSKFDWLVLSQITKSVILETYTWLFKQVEISSRFRSAWIVQKYKKEIIVH